MSFKLSQNEPHELYTQSGLGSSEFITLLLSAPCHKEQDHAVPSARVLICQVTPVVGVSHRSVAMPRHFWTVRHVHHSLGLMQVLGH